MNPLNAGVLRELRATSWSTTTKSSTPTLTSSIPTPKMRSATKRRAAAVPKASTNKKAAVSGEIRVVLN